MMSQSNHNDCIVCFYSDNREWKFVEDELFCPQLFRLSKYRSKWGGGL